MNANYLKASAAVLLSFFAVFGGTPTANAQTELTPKCETPTLDGDPACWLELEEPDQCYVFIEKVIDDMTATWSGRCQAGVPDGRGKLTGNFDKSTPGGGLFDENEYTGSYVDGKRHGRWREKSTDDKSTSDDSPPYKTIRIDTGSYVDGKKHGEWRDRIHHTIFNLDLVFINNHMTTYVDGKKHGPYEMTGDGADSGSFVKGAYVDGKKHGQWEYEYTDGDKNCEEFSNGNKVVDFHDC